MQPNFRFFAAALGLGLGASAASATVAPEGVPPKTTADLVALCTPAGDDPQAGAAMAYCYGFAEGAVDVMLSYSAAGPESHRPFCLPSPTPTMTQVVGDFVNWAKGDASTLQEPAVAGLASYLVDHFPCPSTGRSPRGSKR